MSCFFACNQALKELFVLFEKADNVFVRIKLNAD